MNRAAVTRADFDRQPSKSLQDDDTPLSEALSYLRATDRVLKALGWERHPLVCGKPVRWSPPDPDCKGYVLRNTFVVVREFDPRRVELFVGDAYDETHGDPEFFDNDLTLFVRLLGLSKAGIGHIDPSLMVVAIRSMVLQYAGLDPDAVSDETFAALVFRVTEARLEQPR